MDEADEVWDRVAESLEAFVDAWEQSSIPPSPSDFAPDDPQTRRMTLVELVKIDLEYRRQGAHEVLRLEDYADQIQDLLATDEMPADLIYEEFNLRRRDGEDVDVTEYFKRFPLQSDQLRDLLGLNSPEVTTSLGMAARPTGLSPGDEIDDFELLSELGSGAFATVYLARQKSLQRIVALKVSRNRGSEPQTLAQLDHPHIGRVYDQRILAEQDLRLLYMKYVPGGTLDDVIKFARETPADSRTGATVLASVDQALDRRGEEPPLESAARDSLAGCDWANAVCRIGVQLAEALDYAHGRGVLHRDLKPANILMSAEGSPQLVDFNISFSAQTEGSSAAAYFGGSLAYMSPEQLEAANPGHERRPDTLDERSDIYSLGVVLWETFSAKRPFQDKPFCGDWTLTLREMAARRADGPELESLMVGDQPAPLPLRKILGRCLSADPDDRPVNGAELAAELRLCLNPQAYELLRPPEDGWSVFARRWSMALLLVLAMTPNILAGWFNFVYNRDQIVATLKESQGPFWTVQAIINSIAYPLGVILLGASYYGVVQAANGRSEFNADRAARLRARCLNLGQTSALISAAEWIVAGFAYPISMNAAGVELGPGDYVHFLISLALCGIIAATYPFFGVTAFAVHILYPRLLAPIRDKSKELERLGRLEKLVWFFLALGFLLPMFAVVLVVTFGTDQFRSALIILSGGSLVGCCGLFWAARRIQGDLGTLRDVVEFYAVNRR